jgi:hypothetical protein
LKNVVFRDTAYHPRVTRVPRKIRDLGCMATMDKLIKEREGRERNENIMNQTLEHV